MRLIRRTPWPGHTEIVLVVGRWRPIYARFNRMFAVATHRVELVITDDGAWYEKRRAPAQNVNRGTVGREMP